MQHTGAACEPIVSVGDRVLAGQKIADSEVPVSAPIHSPVSGTVKAIEPRAHFSGLKLESMVIIPDGKQESVQFKKGPADPDPQEIREMVREAGIVGLGGAAFPTSIKLTPPQGVSIDSVVINGCECEPYLTVDHRLMLEEPDKIIDGLRLLKIAVGAKRGYIGIESNKPDAIEVLSAKGKREGIEVVALETKYPQGAEKQLIKSVLNREVPPGALPSAVGALVQNAGTAIAISEAVRDGKPLTKKVLTVSGSGMNEPANMRVMVGTPINEIIAAAKGLKAGTAKVIFGGPMMGVAVSNFDASVVKSTSGIIALSKQEAQAGKIDPCIKCSRCVSACPMGLMPNRLGAIVEIGVFDELQDENIYDCVECACCAFVCPARRPLVQNIKLGKYQLNLEKQRQKTQK